MTIREQAVVKRLVQFIEDTADLDDLAALYSTIMTDDPIVVVGDYGKSDEFQDGRRTGRAT